MRSGPLLFVVFVVLGVTPFAQVKFDAASVKANTNIADNPSLRLMPGGGITASHIPARTYVSLAYQLQGYFQLANAPDWTTNTYFDVQAKPAAAATREETFAMLQALLRDRFHLQVHRESRQLEGYALVVLRSGHLGPNLQSSTVDCEKAFTTTPRCREGRIMAGSLKGVGVSLFPLVQVAMGEVQAPVIDATQLTGPFDIDLRWSTEATPTGDTPSLFTAVQEQLGLKLERKRVPVEMLVIDHIERPTPD
jgi:uncharacterized protein (TIGR03435 family)